MILGLLLIFLHGCEIKTGSRLGTRLKVKVKYKALSYIFFFIQHFSIKEMVVYLATFA